MATRYDRAAAFPIGRVSSSIGVGDDGTCSGRNATTTVRQPQFALGKVYQGYGLDLRRHLGWSKL
jgi:hypothetical protein